jgi:hypothetical protein
MVRDQFLDELLRRRSYADMVKLCHSFIAHARSTANQKPELRTTRGGFARRPAD